MRHPLIDERTRSIRKRSSVVWLPFARMRDMCHDRWLSGASNRGLTLALALGSWLSVEGSLHLVAGGPRYRRCDASIRARSRDLLPTERSAGLGGQRKIGRAHV